MSYDAQEKSTAGGRPFELYLFQGTGIDFAVTSADTALDHVAHTFEPTTISRSEFEANSDVQSGQITVYVNVDHPIAQLFIAGLPPSPVALVVYRGHFDDSERSVIFSGSVSSARFDGDQCELTCNSDQYKIQGKIPKILYQSACPLIFGSPQCGVDLSALTYPGTVSAISADGETVTVPAFASLPHSLRGGTITFGNFKRMVIAHVGGVLTLLTGIPGLGAGAAVHGTAGCQQTFASCVEYNNIGRFLGFDLIPQSNPFDGAIS